MPHYFCTLNTYMYNVHYNMVQYLQWLKRDLKRWNSVLLKRKKKSFKKTGVDGGKGGLNIEKQLMGTTLQILCIFL